MTEKTEDYSNSQEAGAIWLGTTKAGVDMLSIRLEGRQLHGFANLKKSDDPSDDAKPDYNIVEFTGNPKQPSNLVGAAWSGLTKQNNDKLNIRLGSGANEVYYTAVMREVVEGQPDTRADMTIFKPTSD